MLDTNIVSYIARNQSPAARRLLSKAQTTEDVCISVITEGEILYGLEKRPEAHRVAYYVHATLANLQVLPWTSSAASTYARLRARNERVGVASGALDLLIAAHALSEQAVLVTNDRGLSRLAGGPETVNWAEDLRSN